jgi:DNA-directed RNA polymerase subunit M/transcription elongation factor TFIIS
MKCKLCGREMESEAEHCGVCKQIVSSTTNAVESHDRPVMRIVVGPEDASDPSLDQDGSPKPTKTAECPDCGHTIFKVIGPKFDEPHEHNMLIVECTGCGFKGQMRWQGVARTTLRIRAASPNLPNSNADRQ